MRYCAHAGILPRRLLDGAERPAQSRHGPVGADGLVAVLQRHKLASQRVVRLLQAAVVLLGLMQLGAQHLHVLVRTSQSAAILPSLWPVCCALRVAELHAHACMQGLPAQFGGNLSGAAALQGPSEAEDVRDVPTLYSRCVA